MSALLFTVLTISILHISHNDASCSFTIEAVTETPLKYPFANDTRSPDCDDTAIIINGNKSDSLIAGTLKEGGLELYNLNGTKLQHIPAPPPPDNNSTNKPGRFNNVATLMSKMTNKPIVIVTDRGLDQLRFYKLNSDNLLMDVTNATIPWVFSTSQEQVNKQQTGYGLTATNYGNSMTAFVSKRHQNIVAKVEIIEIDEYNISYKVTETFPLPLMFNITTNSGNMYTWKACTDADDENPQIEGMVVDPMDGTLLIAQETVGLFKTNMKDADYTFTLIDMTKEFGVNYTRKYDTTEEEYVCEYDYTTDPGLGGNIEADAEGISLWMDDDDGGYYVQSSQGGSFFNLYSRKNITFVGTFEIFLGDDQVENTDGVECGSGDFGSNYPEGILIVQDESDNGTTNFKFASFEDILDGIYECDENINSTQFFTTICDDDDCGGGNSGGGGGDDSGLSQKEEETIILALAIVFAVLLVTGIGIFIFLKCKERPGQKAPVGDNKYVELN